MGESLTNRLGSTIQHERIVFFKSRLSVSVGGRAANIFGGILRNAVSAVSVLVSLENLLFLCRMVGDSAVLLARMLT